MIETLSRISNDKASIVLVNKVIAFGQALSQQPIHLLDGVAEVLKHLKSDYRLVVATKGELGGYAVHIPYHTTRAHEQITESLTHDNFLSLNTMTEIIEILKN